MTVKQIAEAVGKTERAVRNWVNKVAENSSVVAEKISASSPAYPADYTQAETLEIIRQGMGEVPAGVYKANAEGSQNKISYKELQQLRLAVRDGVLSVEEARRAMGLSPELVEQKLSSKVATQVYAVAAKAIAREQAKLEDKRNNPELFEKLRTQANHSDG